MTAERDKLQASEIESHEIIIALKNTIEDLRDNICSTSERSDINGTLLNESEQTISKLKSENAELRKQLNELMTSVRNQIDSKTR
jgi:predicted transcriptional regulator